MPLLQVNAVGSCPVIAGGAALSPALADAVRGLPRGAPIVILVHGYKFTPFETGRDPHRHILSVTPDPKPGALSWPRHLGFGRNRADEGLCIAFGWRAHGTIWSAYREAARAGDALAALIGRIGEWTARPVDLVGHSLGARVALTGVAQARHGQVGRVILMAAAEFQRPAAKGLASPVGQRAEFINIASRENDLFDMMIERLVHPLGRQGRALGAGIAGASENWLDVQIDNDDTLHALAELGHRIPPPTRRVCHWSGYLRPGMLALYSDLLRDRERLTLARLRQALPATRDPRWSRLLARPRPGTPLPFARKAAS